MTHTLMLNTLDTMSLWLRIAVLLTQSTESIKIESTIYKKDGYRQQNVRQR